MSSPILVDDSDSAVQYAPGWIWDQLVDEVDHTRHGAPLATLTASLGFSGTGIQVVGSLEPTDHNGQPTTTYAIDGEVIATYTAPFTATGDAHLNVTFFSKRDLPAGDHELVITNVNGTNPTIFWLDYFLIDQPPTSPAPSQPATLANNAPSSAPVTVTVTGDPAGNTRGSDIGTSSTSHSSSLGAIVGGVVGAVVLVVLLLIVYLLWQRQKRERAQNDAEPFVSTREHRTTGQIASFPSSNPSGIPSFPSSNSPGITSFPSSDSPSITSLRPPIKDSIGGGIQSPFFAIESHQQTPTLYGTSEPESTVPLIQSAQIDHESNGVRPNRAAAPLVFPTSDGSTSTTTHPDSWVPPASLGSEEASRAPWYTPPGGRQSRAQSLLRMLSSHTAEHSNNNNSMSAGNRSASEHDHDVDSGLRILPPRPPPYTPD